MEYTIQRLGRLAGVSTRTLRYYDEIGLLKPARVNSSGYRIYGPAEVDRLQQILFHWELGISLDKIRAIITNPSFNHTEALKEHLLHLLDKRQQLNILIDTVEKTIGSQEGRFIMTDAEKFAGLKRKTIEGNEQKYGTEIRAKYGADAVNKSNEKLLNMSKDAYDELTRLGERVTVTLREALKTGNPASEVAQRAAELHKEWLCYHWTEYSPKAHANLAQMYVDDERFKAYYDKDQPGTAEFLRDAILIYTGRG